MRLAQVALVAHGSRDPAANARVARLAGEVGVAHGFIQFGPPPPAAELYVPCFLFDGAHVRLDLPAGRRTAILGSDPVMREILRDRVDADTRVVAEGRWWGAAEPRRIVPYMLFGGVLLHRLRREWRGRAEVLGPLCEDPRIAQAVRNRIREAA